MSSFGLSSDLGTEIPDDKEVLLLTSNTSDFANEFKNNNIDAYVRHLTQCCKSVYALAHYPKEKAEEDKLAKKEKLDALFAQIPEKKVKKLQDIANRYVANLPFRD